MAEKLNFDDGIKEYEVNGRELLRFNPSDPNVYNRFCELYEELSKLEESYEAELKRLEAETTDDDVESSGKALKLMHDIDAKVKARLSYVFGEGNDFDRIMGGVNLMAIGKNGERIVTNLLAALQPIIEDGIRQHQSDAAAEAVAAAKLNREQRCAKK